MRATPQGAVPGLSLVDLNHPQHTAGLAPSDVAAALRSAGLAAGAVCMRYPAAFRLGALSNPDAQVPCPACAHPHGVVHMGCSA